METHASPTRVEDGVDLFDDFVRAEGYRLLYAAYAMCGDCSPGPPGRVRRGAGGSR